VVSLFSWPLAVMSMYFSVVTFMVLFTGVFLPALMFRSVFVRSDLDIMSRTVLICDSEALNFWVMLAVMSVVKCLFLDVVNVRLALVFVFCE